MSSLPSTLRVQTFVNGEKRQDGTTEDLIFSIANLVKTLSEGTTLQAGDVLATGTPAGVGFGLDPPTFLKPGDVVEVSITGLGKLRNRVADTKSPNYVEKQALQKSHLPTYNAGISCGGVGLTSINNKLLNVQSIGSGAQKVVFVHGLGGTTEFFRPLIQATNISQTHTSTLYDLEGHGLSPTKASSIVSIDSYANDLAGIFAHSELSLSSGGVLVAHSMGCLIALAFTLSRPSLVQKLILIGPPPNPLPAPASENSRKRAAAVRAGGMASSSVAEAVTNAGTSQKTKSSRPLALTAVRASLLSQDPEGYAKGCTALAGATKEWDFSKIKVPTLIVTGSEDGICPPKNAEAYRQRLGGECKVVVLEGVGHWHVFEDLEGVKEAVGGFL